MHRAHGEQPVAAHVEPRGLGIEGDHRQLVQRRGLAGLAGGRRQVMQPQIMLQQPRDDPLGRGEAQHRPAPGPEPGDAGLDLAPVDHAQHGAPRRSIGLRQGHGEGQALALEDVEQAGAEDRPAAEQQLAGGIDQARLALGCHHHDGIVDGAQHGFQPAVEQAAPVALPADQARHRLLQPIDLVARDRCRARQGRAQAGRDQHGAAQPLEAPLLAVHGQHGGGDGKQARGQRRPAGDIPASRTPRPRCEARPAIQARSTKAIARSAADGGPSCIPHRAIMTPPAVAGTHR